MELATASEAADARPGSVPGTPAISVRSVSKSFPVPGQGSSSLRDRLLHPSRSAQQVRALRGVSLEVRQGEVFGVVGRNGSGKSTLMRCLAGIYRPDSGSVAVQGRLAPFIELGAAFDADASVTENAMLTSIALGLSRREARAHAPHIVEAAGLTDFASHKLKNLSSGMTARLAFASTMEVQADVVLLDEVLAVGDRAFRRRCEERLDQLRGSGTTIVLVNHGMDAIRKLCDRAALIDRGRVVMQGTADEVAQAYEDLSDREPDAIGARAQPAERGAADPEPEPAPEAPASRVDRGGVRRVLSVAWTLALARFRRRYLDSVLGYAWAVLRPLSFFAVLYVFFTEIADFDRGVPDYGAYLLTAFVLWIMFADSTTTSMSSIVRGIKLLRAIPLPAIVMPLSVLLSCLLDLAMNLIAVACFLAIAGIEPRLTWLEMPLIVLLVTAFAAGAGMLLAALFIGLRDMDQLWASVRQAMMYGSPIVYVATVYPDSVREVLTAMPLAAALTQMRHAIIDPSAPTLGEVVGGFPMTVVPAAIAAAVLAAGVVAVTRAGATAAERA